MKKNGSTEEKSIAGSGFKVVEDMIEKIQNSKKNFSDFSLEDYKEILKGLKKLNKKLKSRKGKIFKIVKNVWKKLLGKRIRKEDLCRQGLESMSKMSFRDLGILRENTIGFDHTPTYNRTDTEAICKICGKSKICIIISENNFDEKTFLLFICDECINIALTDWYVGGKGNWTGSVSGESYIGMSPVEYLKSKCVCLSKK